MRKSEYRVRRVERFIVTHYEASETSACSRGFGGEISNAADANRLALMLCAADEGSIVMLEPEFSFGESSLTSDEAKRHIQAMAHEEAARHSECMQRDATYLVHEAAAYQAIRAKQQQ